MSYYRFLYYVELCIDIFLCSALDCSTFNCSVLEGIVRGLGTANQYFVLWTPQNCGSRICLEVQGYYYLVESQLYSAFRCCLHSQHPYDFHSCQAQPQSQLKLGCSWFYSQLLRPAVRPSVRPSGIVLSRSSMTLTLKAKLFISMIRL